MRPFKFFNAPDKIFPEWMDRMDDHILGNIPPQDDIRETTTVYQDDMCIYELGWDAADYEYESGYRVVCPFDSGTRDNELWVEGYVDRCELRESRRQR
jgi:hypothetical protein